MARRSSHFSKLRYLIFAIFIIISAWLALINEPPLQETGSPSGVLSVHFLDVGQADSILIQQGSSAMLIDGGNNEDINVVLDYLEEKDISKLNYVVGTHPHEDHIGGLDGVINKLTVDAVIMPKVSHNTKTYEDVLSAIKSQGLKITTPRLGQQYNLGDAKFTILSPSKDKYEELNDYSIAIRLDYGDQSFLFLGDCERVNEEEMLQSGLPLSSDVVKLGHHGSSSSTTEEFIAAVKPKYAVISVGKDNDYNHPHKEVIKRLNQHGIEILRTDESGTIVFSTNGESLSFKKSVPE